MNKRLSIIREPLILSCVKCKKEFELTLIEHECPECGSLLAYRPELKQFPEEFTREKKNFKFWDYAFAMPPIEKDFQVTLSEGGTPCKPSKKMGEILGVKKLYFKDETLNPTNSFKDRAAALLISHARSWNYQKAVCASQGNQGASIAAYTALEVMKCVNIIPEEIDIGKRAQMIAYNSEIVIAGKIVDDAIKLSLDPKFSKSYYQCTPEFNPLTIEAQKTIAFEIFQEFGNTMPDWMIVPMGSGGCLVRVWKGFSELMECGIIDALPRIVGVQSSVCAPIVDAFSIEKVSNIVEKEMFQSRARSLMVKSPLYQSLAIEGIKESGGTALAVPENEMLIAAEELAQHEGIFAEPASALTLAAISKLIEHHGMDASDSVVCLITGSGLKAPYVLEALSTRTKTAGMGPILSTKLKILTHISISKKTGINGTKLKQIIGSISLSAIYQHLKDLETKKLIIRQKEGKKVFFQITEDGKKVLDALDILIKLL